MKVKTCTDRKEVYAVIKKNAYEAKIKEITGKSFTNLTTDVLLELIADFSEKKEAKKVVKAKENKPSLEELFKSLEKMNKDLTLSVNAIGTYLKMFNKTVKDIKNSIKDIEKSKK